MTPCPFSLSAAQKQGHLALCECQTDPGHDEACPFLWADGAAALLADVCRISDLNAVYPNNMREKEPTARYHEIKTAYAIINNAKGRALLTHPGAALTWAREHADKPNSKAYLLTAVDEADHHLIQIHQQKTHYTITLKGTVSWMMNPVAPTPPYLALLEISPGDSGTIARRAWLTQVSDKGLLIPISHNHHRVSLTLLIREMHRNKTLREMVSEIRYFIPGEDRFGEATLMIVSTDGDELLVDLVQPGEKPRTTLYHAPGSEKSDAAFIRAVYAALKH